MTFDPAATDPPAWPTALPDAPKAWADAGRPRFGLWSGELPPVRFGDLAAPFGRGRLRRLAIEKRWEYVLLATSEVMVAVAIIDGGYVSSAFCGVVDRASRRLLCDYSAVLPPGLASVNETGPAAAVAALRAPGLHLRIARDGAETQLEVDWRECRLEATLTSPIPVVPAATALVQLGEDRLDCTRKRVALQVRGALVCGARRFGLASACAGTDSTAGLLPREVTWRWAFGLGRPGDRVLGFNLSAGFLEPKGSENVAWIDGRPCALGPARFFFDAAKPEGQWRIEGAALALEFTPEAARAQSVDLRVLQSRYLQPFGSFAGWVTAPDGERLRLDGLPGVTEDHTARW